MNAFRDAVMLFAKCRGKKWSGKHKQTSGRLFSVQGVEVDHVTKFPIRHTKGHRYFDIRSSIYIFYSMCLANWRINLYCNCGIRGLLSKEF